MASRNQVDLESSKKPAATAGAAVASAAPAAAAPATADGASPVAKPAATAGAAVASAAPAAAAPASSGGASSVGKAAATAGAAVALAAPAAAAMASSGGASSAARNSGSVVVAISDDLQHVAPETEPLLAGPNGDSHDEGLGLGDDGGATADDDDQATTGMERTMAKAFRSTADLAKHLPTGAVLVFEVLSPVFTNGGKCDDVSRVMTAWLVGLCAAGCFFLCFTDSFRDAKGTVRYVVATRRGLWVIDGTPPPPPEKAAEKKLRFIDFFHAFLSLVVFMSVAMFDKNVGACFYPVMSYDTRQVLTAVPLAGGLVGTMLFATFPSTRHGIGFPAVPTA